MDDDDSQSRISDEKSPINSGENGYVERISSRTKSPSPPRSPSSLWKKADSRSNHFDEDFGLDSEGVYHGAATMKQFGALGYGKDILSSIEQEIDIPHEEPGQWLNLRTLWGYTGPGFLITMAYLDPGNLEADLQAGAYANYSLLWVLFWATVLGYVCQVMALKLGVVANLSLAECCRMQYPKVTQYIIWISMEIAATSNDIQEITGTAIALNILLDIPIWAGCLITVFNTFVLLSLSYWGMRKLEASIGVMVGMMVICFWVQYGYATTLKGSTANLNVDSNSVAYGTVVPTMSNLYLLLAVGLVGGTIEPCNLFLHSAVVKSRKIDRSNKTHVSEAIKYYAIESGISIFISFLINLAIISVFASTFYDDSDDPNEQCAQQGLAWIPAPEGSPNATYGSNGLWGECNAVGLQNAGDALQPVFGNAGTYLWGVGLLAAGEASTMTNTLSGQYIMEGFINIRLPPWKRLLLTRCISLIPALSIALTQEGQEAAFNILNEWLNIVQNIVLPLSLLPLIHFVSQRRVMGDYTMGWFGKILYWLVVGFVVVVNYYTFFSWVYTPDVAGSDGTFPESPGFYSFFGGFLLVYTWMMWIIVKYDLLEFWYNFVIPMTNSYLVPFLVEKCHIPPHLLDFKFLTTKFVEALIGPQEGEEGEEGAITGETDTGEGETEPDGDGACEEKGSAVDVGGEEQPLGHKESIEMDAFDKDATVVPTVVDMPGHTKDDAFEQSKSAAGGELDVMFHS